MDCNVSCKCKECGKLMEFDTTNEAFNLRILMKALEGIGHKCMQCALRDLSIEAQESI